MTLLPSQVLCSESIARFIDEHFVIWAHDLTDSRLQQQILSECQGIFGLDGRRQVCVCLVSNIRIYCLFWNSSWINFCYFLMKCLWPMWGYFCFVFEICYFGRLQAPINSSKNAFKIAHSLTITLDSFSKILLRLQPVIFFSQFKAIILVQYKYKQ